MKLWNRKRRKEKKITHEKKHKDGRQANQQMRKLQEQRDIVMIQSMLNEEESLVESPITKEDNISKNSTNDKDSVNGKITSIERKKVNYKNPSDCLEYVSEQLEMIAMVDKQLAETKIEYSAVTEYLTDIQKIEQIPEEDKDNLMEAARRILNLTQERNRFQNREVKISDIMFKHLEKYEEIIPSEIVKMKKNEEYEHLIKTDMQNLESEKAALTYEKEELMHKKSYMQSIAIIASILTAILFITLGIFQAKFAIDITLPILFTVMVGILAVLFLFLENNRTNAAIRLNDRKLNKAIGLMNKIKIKFVNNRNNLDYTYQKFRVHASKELEYLWEQYVKLKDETRRYQQNTELLEYNRNVLIDQLENYEVQDAEVWLYQPIALVDGKEMVEVRHRLNTRRQKLREQIDYNNSILRNSKQEIDKVVQQAPELEYQVDKIMKEKWPDTIG